MLFDRSQFHPLKNKINNSVIKNLLKSHINDHKIFNNNEISNICSINSLNNNSILFLDSKRTSSFKINDQFNLIILTNDKKFFSNLEKINIFLINNIDKSFLILANFMFYHEDQIDFEDEFRQINNSYISKYASVHKTSKIYNNCVIGRGVEIGKNCIIKNNVVIKNTIIKDNVIIGDNSSIGTSGFGFNLNSLGSKNLLPQIGIVIIDENVRIGSNCTIDRAKIDYTYIGKNSMIDNLVHIAHNVIISDNACVAAQTGVSGSTQIGSNLIAGGQSGFAGHLKIGNNVIVAAKSGVTKNIPDNSVVAGFPATDINKWKKIIINQRKNGHK